MAHVGQKLALGFVGRGGGFRGLEQCQSILLPLCDVALRARHRQGNAVRVALQRATHTIPARLASPRLGAHLHIHQHVVSNTAFDRLAQSHAVIGKQNIEEFLPRAEEFLLFVAEHFGKMFRHPHLAARHIEFPQTIVGAARRALEPGIGGVQFLLGDFAPGLALEVVEREYDIAPHVHQQLHDLVFECVLVRGVQQQSTHRTAVLNQRQCNPRCDTGLPRRFVPMHGAGIILEVVADAWSLCSKRGADESPTDRRRTVNRNPRIAQGIGALAGSRHYLRIPRGLVRHTNACRLEPAAVYRRFAHALI